MSKDILVVAAHPDDEILGCGASIAKHARRGDRVHVLILAEGATSRAVTRRPEQHAHEFRALRSAAEEAAAVLGVVSLQLMGFPDNRMDSVDLLDVVKVVEARLHEVAAKTVYTHHDSDLNIDHQIVHRAVVTACRPTPGQTVRELLFFEVTSSTEWGACGSVEAFTPNWFEDVSDCLDLKLEALRKYQGEMRNWPHARSLQAVEHLARWRGASIGCVAAEAFVLGRRISGKDKP